MTKVALSEGYSKRDSSLSMMLSTPSTGLTGLEVAMLMHSMETRRASSYSLVGEGLERAGMFKVTALRRLSFLQGEWSAVELVFDMSSRLMTLVQESSDSSESESEFKLVDVPTFRPLN